MAVEWSRPAVSLEPLRAGDLVWLARWERDDEVARLMGRRFADAAEVDRWWMTLHRGAGRQGFAIRLYGRLIGDVELEHIRRRTGEAEVRICIGDRRCWGRGYGGEALRQLMAYAFGDLGLTRLYLRVAPDNLRAIRCYQRLGFQKRGRLKATGRLLGQPELILMDLARALDEPSLAVRASRAASLSTPAE